MLRLVVAGSRTFKNYYEAKKILTSVLRNRSLSDVCIISGGAKGADAIGELFAKEFGCDLKIYPAEWDLYGKSAGHKRNEVMAKNSDATILFWDGHSKGSKSMHTLTLDYNHPLFVVYFDANTQKIIKQIDESNPF